jgi:3-hydroxyisobutyrate dehydrogenase-like beta-hydroxyacid dehydrogenase
MNSITIGFIGLGNMGMPMAKSLVKNGFLLTVYDLRKEAVEEIVSLGATPASSCRDVAAAGDVIISMVRDVQETDEVIFSKGGVWEGIKEGSTVILSSTISPAYCRDVYVKAKEKNVNVIDCAVSDPSGQSHILGGLTLFIGGDKDVVKKCSPIFQALGKNIFYLGTIGKGQACKLVHQLNAFSISTVTRECLNLGLKAGLDLKTMVEAMSAGLGSTRGLQNMAETLRTGKVVTTPVRPPPSGSTGAKALPPMGNKDKQLAFEMARELGVETPICRFIDEIDTALYEAYSNAMKQYIS